MFPFHSKPKLSDQLINSALTESIGGHEAWSILCTNCDLNKFHWKKEKMTKDGYDASQPWLIWVTELVHKLLWFCFPLCYV